MDGVAERVLRFHQQAAMVEVELARAAQRIRRGDFAGRVVGEGDGLGVAVSIGAAQTALRVVGEVAPRAARIGDGNQRVRSSRREESSDIHTLPSAHRSIARSADARRCRRSSRWSADQGGP